MGGSLGWSTLGLRLPLHVYPEALAPGVLPKLLNHNFGKRPLLDRLFVSIEDQSRRKKHADAPMTAPSNTSGGVTSSVGRPCGAASTAASCATPASTKKGSASRARATAGATANCAAERLVARLGWHWRRAVPPFYRARLRRAVEGVREKPCRKPSSLNKVMSSKRNSLYRLCPPYARPSSNSSLDHRAAAMPTLPNMDSRRTAEAPTKICAPFFARSGCVRAPVRADRGPLVRQRTAQSEQLQLDSRSACLSRGALACGRVDTSPPAPIPLLCSRLYNRGAPAFRP